jgi:asparagine synthase (glutamine-hydrolysing)
MCGIWALLQQSPVLTTEYLESLNRVKNRGPDSSIIHIDRNYIGCFHRLAINDISVSGNQPFYYSNNEYNYILMANGEIYNHKKLETKYNIHPNSHSDCAVLLPLFMHLEEDFALLNNELRGEYAILIIKQHKISNEIQYFASTDPLSVRPLFYFVSNETNTIGFSSLLGGLSELSNEVERLDQGCMIIGKILFGESNIEANKFEVNRYHKIPVNSKIITFNDSDTESLYKLIVSVLTEAIILRLESDRPIGCLLSGGLDSSLVAAIAAKELRKRGQKLRTFSIGMEDGTDLAYARMVAKHIDSDHTEFHFTQEEGLEVVKNIVEPTETYDITTNRASVGQNLIAKMISEQTDIKVVLNGDGADEAQMGYLYFYLHPSLSDAELERNKLLQQIHLFDGLRVDRNISHYGLEARVPFLDKEFIDLYYSIPTELLVPTKDRMEKYLIRKAFDIVEPNLLPSDVLWRKKEAFSDGVSSKEKSWYLIVKDYFNELISDEEFELRHNYDGFIPLCKESYYYRREFEKLFKQNHKVIPRYWLANWTNSTDPSARTLNVYTESKQNNSKTSSV